MLKKPVLPTKSNLQASRAIDNGLLIDLLNSGGPPMSISIKKNLNIKEAIVIGEADVSAGATKAIVIPIKEITARLSAERSKGVFVKNAVKVSADGKTIRAAH